MQERPDHTKLKMYV